MKNLLGTEFSVVLSCDPETSDAIEQFRRHLSPSKYYDSSVHMTLLRGISKNTNLSDQEIISMVKESVNITGCLVTVSNL